MVKQHGEETLGTPPPPPPPLVPVTVTDIRDNAHNRENILVNNNSQNLQVNNKNSNSPPAPFIKIASRPVSENHDLNNDKNKVEVMSSSLPIENIIPNLDECRKNLKFLNNRRKKKMKRQLSS